MEYSGPQGISISVHPDAQGDLERIWRFDGLAAALIQTTLGEVANSTALLRELRTFGVLSYPEPIHSVKKWATLHRLGARISRLRLLELDEYRVLYAYHSVEDRYYVLGISHRSEINYDDPSDSFTSRLVVAYDEIGFP